MLRADPVRQGRRPRRSDAADLAGLGHRPRHQGRELAADRRLARTLRPRAAVRSDQRRKRPPTIRCSRSAAASGRSATSRTSPTSWSTPKARSSGATIGRRPAIRSWSARSCMSSMPSPTRRSPASPTSCPIPRRPIETTLHAMMTTPHLGEAGAASRRRLGCPRAAQQVRQRALRRALHRDVVPRPLPRSGRGAGDAPLRLAHRRSGRRTSSPTTLYLVVPPSDISRTKPLIRLILNQIGRRLTEDLNADEPPASPAADARRVPGAWPARLLRVARSPSWRATA